MESLTKATLAKHSKAYFEDKCLIKPSKEIQSIGNEIFRIIENGIQCSQKEKVKYYNYLNFKLNNLAIANSLKNHLVYSRDKNKYLKKYCCEENKSFWELAVVTTVSDLMESNFFIKQTKGKLHLYNPNRHMTIVELRPKLKQMLFTIKDIGIHYSERIEQIELREKKIVTLKNGKEIKVKKSIGYKDTDHERIPIMRRELSEIYQFYKQQDLSGYLSDHVSAKQPELLKVLKQYNRTGKIKLTKTLDGYDFTIIHRMVRRIFNNGTFLHGGRIYAFWQNIPRKLRKYLMINGSPVAELDYSACQLKLIYHMMLKQDYTGGDPYNLPGISRDLAKKAAIITLNAKTYKSSILALMGSAKKDLNQNIDYYEAKRCIDLFIEKHLPIADYFNSEAGVSLMRVESEVIIRTILAMMNKKICILTIHDSCIFPIQYKTDVYNAMIDEYKSILKHPPSVKLEN
jgi:hypothetical protein